MTVSAGQESAAQAAIEIFNSETLTGLDHTSFFRGSRVRFGRFRRRVRGRLKFLFWHRFRLKSKDYGSSESSRFQRVVEISVESVAGRTIGASVGNGSDGIESKPKDRTAGDHVERAGPRQRLGGRTQL